MVVLMLGACQKLKVVDFIDSPFLFYFHSLFDLCFLFSILRT